MAISRKQIAFDSDTDALNTSNLEAPHVQE